MSKGMKLDHLIQFRRRFERLMLVFWDLKSRGRVSTIVGRLQTYKIGINTTAASNLMVSLKVYFCN